MAPDTNGPPELQDIIPSLSSPHEEGSQDNGVSTTITPRCVASSGLEDSPFYQAQFSADGTTIITHSANSSLRTFILPIDLLDDSKQPHGLSSTCTIPSPSALQSYALYPHFNLADPSTAVLLRASTDLPITLINAISGQPMNAKYQLIDPMTEAYIAPNSLVWTPDGLRFVAGSRNQISVFDAHRYNEGPVLTHKTTNSKRQKKLYGGMSGCSGLIMALSISPDGLLAAGTTEGQIALYDGVANTECWTSFSIANTVLERRHVGGGVTQLAWSPDGTYLLAAERQSDGVHVYDIRNTSRYVSFLAGRRTRTPQRMGVDVVPTVDGYELWAGGMDGCVRMWNNPGSIEGEHRPDAESKMHDDPISSAVWHPLGAVMATCAGLRRVSPTSSNEDDGESADDDDVNAGVPDNSLKIWTI